MRISKFLEVLGTIQFPLKIEFFRKLRVNSYWGLLYGGYTNDFYILCQAKVNGKLLLQKRVKIKKESRKRMHEENRATKKYGGIISSDGGDEISSKFDFHSVFWAINSKNKLGFFDNETSDISERKIEVSLSKEDFCKIYFEEIVSSELYYSEKIQKIFGDVCLIIGKRIEGVKKIKISGVANLKNEGKIEQILLPLYLFWEKKTLYYDGTEIDFDTGEETGNWYEIDNSLLFSSILEEKERILRRIKDVCVVKYAD